MDVQRENIKNKQVAAFHNPLLQKIVIDENLDFPQKRIQIVEPASGKGKRNKAVSHITEFINTVFNTDGTYKSTELIKNVSKESCQWCPFKDNKELCNKDSSF